MSSSFMVTLSLFVHTCVNYYNSEADASELLKKITLTTNRFVRGRLRHKDAYGVERDNMNLKFLFHASLAIYLFTRDRHTEHSISRLICSSFKIFF